MNKAGELARKNLEISQSKMKTWYDKSSAKIFDIGNKVLVLLPIPGYALQARYSGPYAIEKKINDVGYVVATPNRRKEKRLSHVNMIKLYQARDQEPQRALCNAVFTVTAGDRQDMEASPRLSNSKLLANPHENLAYLLSDKQRDLEELLVRFNHLFLMCLDAPTVSIMMWMWVQLYHVSNTLIGLILSRWNI